MTKFGRSFVFALAIILVVFGAAVAGYHLSTVIGEVTVKEPISVDLTDFTMLLWPNDEQLQQMVITNSGDTSITVTLTNMIEPNDGGVTVELVGVSGTTTIICPGCSTTIPIVVTTNNDVVPGEYIITVTVER